MATAADNKFCNIIPNFRKKVWYYMRIVCQQTILMKYHALFVIFEKAAKFQIVVNCTYYMWCYNNLRTETVLMNVVSTLTN